MPEPPDAGPGPLRLMDMAFGFAPMLAVAAALEVGVFDALSAGEASAQSLAASLGCEPRALGMLLDALVGLALLRRGEQAYGLAPEAAAHLVRGGDAYIGGFFESSRGLLGDWQRLAEAVRTGRPVRSIEEPATAEDFFPSLLEAIHASKLPAARELARRLRLAEASSGPAVLDIGGGSGVWGIGAALESPTARVAVLDFPRILEVARRCAAKAGVTERLSFIAGGWDGFAFAPGSCDLALVGNLCHILGEAGSRELFRRVRPALRSGGRIVVIDIFPSEDLSGPPFAQLFALTMLLHTRRGGTFRESDYRRWLKETGFRPTETFDLGVGGAAVVAAAP